MYHDRQKRSSILFACIAATLLSILPKLSAQVRPLAPVPDMPSANLPAQPVGPNDLIAVSVYDAPELTRTVRVSTEGFIRLPMLKERIKVLGLMPAEVETAISKELKAEDIIVDPFVTVTVADYSSRPISVVGAVRSPLTFQAYEPVTLLEAIARAGGLAPEAGADILVTHKLAATGDAKPELPQRISVKPLITASDPSLNIVLHGGEEVRVPEGGKVYVIGNVKMPGAYAVGDTAESSVLKMLALSQGLMPYNTKIAYIYRMEAGGAKKNEIPIELKKIMKREAPDPPLLANDIFYVPDNTGKRLTVGALDRIVSMGSFVGTAAIYAFR